MLTEWTEMGLVRATVIAAAAVLLPVGFASASDLVPVPEGCTALFTVQKALCQTTTMLDCGDHKEAHTYLDGAPIVIHTYAPDWELREFRFADGSARMTAVPETGSNTDLDAMWETGTAEESGEFVFNTNVIKDREYVLDGSLTLTGETVDLSGVAFEKARLVRVFELTPGKGGLEFELDVYISRAPDMLFEASWQRSIFGNNLETFDQTPTAISWPGESGFQSTMPEVGCD